MRYLGAEISSKIPKIALVTGGAKRIGRALCEMLACRGFSIALHYYKSREEAASLAQDLREKWGVQAEIFQADLSQEEALIPLMEAVKACFGTVGVLINNASLFERDEFLNVTKESWDKHLAPNLRAPFVLSQWLYRHVLEQQENDQKFGQEAVILHMLDQRVLNLTPHFVSYTVSRSALWSLTKTMALGFAPKIRVNALGLGPVLCAKEQTSEHFTQMCQKTPLARGASVAEVVEAAWMTLTLPSLTGQIIALDGGQHLNWSPP